MALAPRARSIQLARLKATGHVLAEDEHASLVDLGDRVACIEFHTKANIVSEGVLAFIEQAIAERRAATTTRSSSATRAPTSAAAPTSR